MPNNKNCIVWFNDGSIKIFYGWWTNILRAIALYCDETGLETVKAKWTT